MWTRESRRSSALFTLALMGSFLLGVPARAQILNQDEEVQVHNLPALTASSKDPGKVLLTALATVFHDLEICCGEDSALLDSAARSDPASLKDVSLKLQGRHVLSDGRHIRVTAEYLPSDAINAGRLIATILDQHAAIMQWNSHLYVVHGVVYRWIGSGDPGSGGYSQMTTIHKILLWDVRFSDARREVSFDRTTDDLSKVGGVLFLQAAPE